MTAEIIIRYFHFLGIFAVVGSLVGEHLLLKPVMTRSEVKRLAVLDTIYGLSFIVVLAAGFLMWFGVGKPTEFLQQKLDFPSKSRFTCPDGNFIHCADHIFPAQSQRRRQRTHRYSNISENVHPLGTPNSVYHATFGDINGKRNRIFWRIKIPCVPLGRSISYIKSSAFNIP